MLRVRELENKLTHARKKIDSLVAENRVLEVVQRRQEIALTKYESTHAELPLLIKSYGEELMSMQSRLRRARKAYRQLENRFRMQSKELLTVQKKYKHLLDLTKNKQLGEREKLSTQLEEAENKIKQQETKTQNLIKKMELENKNHQYQLNAEVVKIKTLQAELNHMKSKNDALELKVEKFKYQSYGGRRSYVGPSPAEPFGSKIQSKNSLSTGNQVVSSAIRGKPSKPAKPELVHGESELSDHTKDLRKNLMKQVHEDVIHKPNMLVTAKRNSSDSSHATSHSSYAISDLIKKKDVSDPCLNSTAEELEPVAAANPFTLPDKYGLAAIEKHRTPTTMNAAGGELINVLKTIAPKLDRGDADGSDDDDVSSLSSPSDNEHSE